MSAKRSLRKYLAVSVCFVSCSQISFDATAQIFANEWTTPLSDPLLSRPPVLLSGATLPGDGMSIQSLCPSTTQIAATNTANVVNVATTGNSSIMALPEAHALTLIDAVDLALCNNPQVKSAWANIKVQAAALGEARAAYLPTLTASGSRLNDRTDYPGSTLNSTLLKSTTVNSAINWRLFDFGGRGANRRAAQDLLEAALANHEALLQKTLASVVSAYFDVQTAQANWQSRQKNEDLARQTLDTAQRRQNRGAGAQTDTLQAATAVAKATLEKSRAQGAFRKANSVLIYALGLSPATELTVADDLADSTQIIRQELKTWLEQAQSTHPAIVAARAQLEAAKEKVTSTRSEGLPTLDFSGNFYQNGRPNQGLTPTKTRETVIGVTLTITLFDGFARTYKVRGAQAQVEQKEAELQDTEHQILMEIVKTHADASAALENLEASRQLLTAAQDALSSVQRKFDKGVVDILDILNAQAALSDAQQERIRCQAEWRSARLLLLANSGMLGLQGIRDSH